MRDIPHFWNSSMASAVNSGVALGVMLVRSAISNREMFSILVTGNSDLFDIMTAQRED
jgi:hypothetical protein